MTVERERERERESRLAHNHAQSSATKTIYCPGHAVVSGNERTDRLARTADISSGLQHGRAEALRDERGQARASEH